MGNNVNKEMKNITSNENLNYNPCQKLACKIQECLQKNNYSQVKCNYAVDDYNKCMKLNNPTKEELLKKEKEKIIQEESKKV